MSLLAFLSAFSSTHSFLITPCFPSVHLSPSPVFISLPQLSVHKPWYSPGSEIKINIQLHCLFPCNSFLYLGYGPKFSEINCSALLSDCLLTVCLQTTLFYGLCHGLPPSIKTFRLQMLDLFLPSLTVPDSSQLTWPEHHLGQPG